MSKYYYSKLVKYIHPHLRNIIERTLRTHVFIITRSHVSFNLKFMWYWLCDETARLTDVGFDNGRHSVILLSCNFTGVVPQDRLHSFLVAAPHLSIQAMQHSKTELSYIYKLLGTTICCLAETDNDCYYYYFLINSLVPCCG